MFVGVFPAAGGPGGALDVPARCVCFNLLANPGPPQMGGAAAQLRGNRVISQSVDGCWKDKKIIKKCTYTKSTK